MQSNKLAADVEGQRPREQQGLDPLTNNCIGAISEIRGQILCES